jgi:hypothetical protein
MNRSCSRFFQLWLPFSLLVTFSNRTWSAETRVQIRSPQEGTHITDEQEYCWSREFETISNSTPSTGEVP